MAFAVKDNQVSTGGEVVETTGSFYDAVGQAKDRSSSGKTASIALKPTARVVLALDFENAEDWLTKVDVDAARVADVAAESDPAEIAKLLARTDDQVRQAHQRAVRVKFPDHDFEHDGAQFVAGDAVVLTGDGPLLAMPAATFMAEYEKKETPAKVRRPRGDSK